jgi:enoyl-CoA hydratase/carnithine racemase
MRLTSDEAERWGFFNKVTAPETLEDEVRSVSRSLAAGPTFAHAMTKRALHQEWGMALDEAIENEAHLQAMCMETEDFARAYDAFARKQSPVFEGN